jgi:aspartyl-tRNA(Asn)/glutamyl-tRNA(Gln) amidotransferase subunit B
MELVTEPVIHDAETAGSFARELQLLLRYLGAGDANMEKGEMRVEANISISKNDTLGTKVEVKNLNYFPSVERAIAFELERQAALLESGGQVVQETRGWDEVKQVTFSQRKKESSHDYRYFPDPDLPKLKLSEIPEFSSARLHELLPELPWERRARYVGLGLKAEDADMFVRDQIFGTFFDATMTGLSQAEVLLAANYIGSDVAGARAKGTLVDAWLTEPTNAVRMQQLIQLIAKGDLSSRGGKETLVHMFADTRLPQDIATTEGLMQQSDTSALKEIIEKVAVAHPSVVADYKAGKEAALQFLVGQGMKESKGSANPTVLREEFKHFLQ